MKWSLANLSSLLDARASCLDGNDIPRQNFDAVSGATRWCQQVKSASVKISVIVRSTSSVRVLLWNNMAGDRKSLPVGHHLSSCQLIIAANRKYSYWVVFLHPDAFHTLSWFPALVGLTLPEGGFQLLLKQNVEYRWVVFRWKIICSIYYLNLIARTTIAKSKVLVDKVPRINERPAASVALEMT